MKSFVMSIVIPTFGRPEDLKCNVKRLLSIDRQDIEILVVDNDDSGKQIKDFCLQIDDPKFRYIQNQVNIGRSNNIIKAIESASSDFVLLCSTDDEVLLDSIPWIIDVINRFKDFAIIFGEIYLDGGKKSYSYKRYLGAKKIDKGIKAINSFKHLSNLFPFVINRKYLDYQKLYDVNEAYMQYRLALTAAARGPVIYVNKQIASMKSGSSDNNINVEVFKELVSEGAGESWNIGDSYADPISRAKQLMGYIDVVYDGVKTGRDVSKYIDKVINNYIVELHNYVIYCHDINRVRLKVSGEAISFYDAIDEWAKVIQPYFLKKKQMGLYDYYERFVKKIEIERIRYKQANELLRMLENNCITIEFKSLDTYNKEHYDDLYNILGYNKTDKNTAKRRIVFLVPRKISRYIFINSLYRNIGNIFISSSDILSYIISAWLSKPDNKKYFAYLDRW